MWSSSWLSATASALIAELGELRATLDGKGFYWASLTVFESGSSSEPSVSAIPSGADARAFQAADVWRRLGAALAGGAEILGWHPWVADRDSASDYFEMGLRSAPDVETRLASQLAQKPAWFAYSLFSQWLGRSELAAARENGLGLHVLSFVHHGSDRMYRYRYLAFLDPVSMPLATAAWSARSSGAIVLVRVPADGSVPDDPGSSLQLPYARPTYPLVSASNILTFNRFGWWAYIVLSTQALTWSF